MARALRDREQVEPSLSDDPAVAPGWRADPDGTFFVEETEEPIPPQRNPTLWPWLLALLLLVAGGLAAVFLLSREGGESSPGITIAAQRFGMPVVVGLREQRARERLREEGLETGVERRPSAKPRGVVIAQRPKARTPVARGDGILITVSTGPPRRAVPDVVGDPLEAAIADVKAAGFRANVTQAFAQEPAGTVVDQRPQADQKLRKGAVVTLTASKGARPVEVPHLLGTQGSDAAAVLREAGLEPAIATVRAERARGEVVAQNPAAGTEVERGASVRLNVSAGPATTSVPDVVGLTQPEAVAALLRAGLKAYVQLVPSLEPAGTVVAQAKPPGTEGRRGDSVQINVSSGA